MFQTLNHADKILMSRMGRSIMQLPDTKCNLNIAFFCIHGLERNTIHVATFVKWLPRCQYGIWQDSWLLSTWAHAKGLVLFWFKLSRQLSWSSLNLAEQHKREVSEFMSSWEDRHWKAFTSGSEIQSLWIWKISSFFTESSNKEEKIVE